jgi:hypothetical protein
MDPDVTLAHMRKLAETIANEELTPELLEEYATSLAKHILALDTWLKNKGFVPRDWR